MIKAQLGKLTPRRTPHAQVASNDVAPRTAMARRARRVPEVRGPMLLEQFGGLLDRFADGVLEARLVLEVRCQLVVDGLVDLA